MPSITRADSRADQKISSLARLFSVLALALSTASALAEVRVLAWSSVDSQAAPSLSTMVTAYPGANARTVAEQLRKLPEGRRALLMLGSTEILCTHPADRCQVRDAKGVLQTTQWHGPWTSAGVTALQRSATAFFAELRAQGAPIDALILDEEIDFSAKRFIRADYANMNAIKADARFPAIAKRLGFNDLRKVMWSTNEYYRWDEVLQADFDAALTRAVVTPFRAVWPKASVSNYRSAAIARRFVTPDAAGHGIVRGGTGVGTHNSIEFYGLVLPWLDGASFAGTRLGKGPFDLFRMNMHRLRASTASNGKPMMPWVGSYGLGTRATDCMDDYPSALSGTTYWDENVIQLAMHGCDTILLYNPHAWRPEQIAANCNPVSDQVHLSNLISDLNARLGSVSGSSRWFSLPGMQDRVVATGRSVTGGTLWRFSFAPDVSSVVVTLKNGEVREVLREEGTAGAWYFEATNEPLAAKKDGTDVAWVEAPKGSAFPDLDEDGALTEGDLALLMLDMGERGSSLDLDGDGVVTQRDADFFRGVQRSWRDQGTMAAGVRPGSALVAMAR